MPRYVAKLRVTTKAPLTREQLRQFDGDKLHTRALGKLGGHDLRVTLEVRSVDPLSAATRAVGYVLDRIPGELLHQEATLDE